MHFSMDRKPTWVVITMLWDFSHRKHFSNTVLSQSDRFNYTTKENSRLITNRWQSIKLAYDLLRSNIGEASSNCRPRCSASVGQQSVAHRSRPRTSSHSKTETFPNTPQPPSCRRSHTHTTADYYNTLIHWHRALPLVLYCDLASVKCRVLFLKNALTKYFLMK